MRFLRERVVGIGLVGEVEAPAVARLEGRGARIGYLVLSVGVLGLGDEAELVEPVNSITMRPETLATDPLVLVSASDRS